MTEAVDTKRPVGVPTGARLVTLAQLQDSVAGPGGSLRLGPRGSYLRMYTTIWPFGLRGTIRQITGQAGEDGFRRFGLTYAHGTRRPGSWKIMVFLKPGAADRELWIWTLDDETAWRKAGRP